MKGKIMTTVTNIASNSHAAVAGGSNSPVRIGAGALAAQFESLAETAAATIAESEPVCDEVLGCFVGLASRIRSVSFHEGKLLEQGLLAIASAHPDLLVLSQGLRLPIVPAALEALKANDWKALEGLSFDAEARTRKCYTPDLVIVNRRKRTALVIDLKRSLASYGDTNRMDALTCKMMAAALVVPDWLYREHKRLAVDAVGIAIIDGASRPSAHEKGIWALSEIDALLEIEGAAAAMSDLRERFAVRVRAILDATAREALGLGSERSEARVASQTMGDQHIGPRAEEAEEPAGRRVVTFGLAARPQQALRIAH
jgi:hypothetical protein